jgi:hypothetical protein
VVGGVAEVVTVVGVGDADEGRGALADRAPTELGNPPFGDDLSTVFLMVVTTSPAASVGLNLEMWPSSVVEWRTTKPWPPGGVHGPCGEVGLAAAGGVVVAGDRLGGALTEEVAVRVALIDTKPGSDEMTRGSST